MKTAIAGVLVALATGCATSPAPTLSLTDRHCTDIPELGGALEPSFEKKKSQRAEIDSSAPCLNLTDTSKSAYSVFGLPALSAKSYVVTVTSFPIGKSLFSPRLVLLDAQGQKLRELQRDSFLFHDANLRAAIRIHANERFLVVASDPQTVGKADSRIVGKTQVTPVSTGVVSFLIFTGSDSTNSLTYAHSGRVEVELKVLPPEAASP